MKYESYPLKLWARQMTFRLTWGLLVRVKEVAQSINAWMQDSPKKENCSWLTEVSANSKLAWCSPVSCQASMSKKTKGGKGNWLLSVVSSSSASSGSGLLATLACRVANPAVALRRRCLADCGTCSTIGWIKHWWVSVGTRSLQEGHLPCPHLCLWTFSKPRHTIWQLGHRL